MMMPQIVRLLDLVPPMECKRLDDVYVSARGCAGLLWCTATFCVRFSSNVSNLCDRYLVTELMDTDLRKIISSSQPLTVEHVEYFTHQSTFALRCDFRPLVCLITRWC